MSGQPYHYLWALAEAHLLRARSAHDQTQQDVTAAIRCLEAVLLTNLLPLDSEVRTRYRIAELLLAHADPSNLIHADAHLNKASLLLLKQNDPGMRNYQFAIQDLQAKITTAADNQVAEDRGIQRTCSRTVLNALKSAEKEALRLEMWKWFYHFAMRRADMLARDGQVKACCSVMYTAAGEANRVGHLQMKAVLLISLTHHMMKTQSVALAADALAQLSVLFEPPLPPSSTDITPVLPTIAPTQSAPRATVDHEHLRLYYTVTAIIHSLHIGKTRDALARLAFLHAQVERPSTTADAEIDTGVAHVLLTQTNSSSTEIFPVTLLPRNKLYALVFLISGMVHKCDDNLKAKKHLIEGLKTIEKEFENDETSTKQAHAPTAPNWPHEVKIMQFRHLAEVSLTRGEFNDAFRILLKINEWCSEDAQLWRKHQPVVALDWAMLYQALGKFDLATQWLQTALSLGNQDVQFTAKIHLIVMAFAGASPSPASGVMLLHELRDQKPAGTVCTTSQLALLDLVSGMESMINGNIRDTKVKILDCIKTNEALVCVQLRYVTVGLLGDLFLPLDAVQAEKMYTTAYIMAKKSHNDAFAATSAVAINELIQSSGRSDDKYADLAISHGNVVKKATDLVAGRLREWEQKGGPNMMASRAM
ncbi:hypothetical protein PhCBS80983_g06014 [Powellomyces hirtus]|uniref:Uncharacterized protein n=1 Tax=Powellomyces hirtus TaxID=109895 RepID=A0A507DSJ7_9FUNG|nr:hypothetical protein PhCBS80983_g06014 [Powellomyces hirtus]